MMVNLWLTVGIIYILFWNLMGILAGVFLRKTDKNMKWVPLLVAIVTIPPFLFGYFGHD